MGMTGHEQAKCVDAGTTNSGPEQNSVLASDPATAQVLTTRLDLEELPSREEFLSELSLNRAFDHTLRGFLLRSMESIRRLDNPTPKTITWRFPNGPLSASDFAKVRATIIHLKHKLKSGDFFTDYLSPPGPSVNSSHNARALKYGCMGELSREDITKLYAEWDGACYWCESTIEREKTHLDHYIPLVRKGPNIPENLVICCADCNLRKSSKDPLQFAKEIGASESAEKRDHIIKLAAIDPKEYVKLPPRKPQLEVLYVAHLPGLSSFCFAPNFFRKDFSKILSNLPIQRRLFLTSGQGAHSRYWVVDEQLFEPAIRAIRELGIQIAFTVPMYAKGTFRHPTRTEFDGAIHKANGR